MGAEVVTTQHLDDKSMERYLRQQEEILADSANQIKGHLTLI